MLFGILPKGSQSHNLALFDFDFSHDWKENVSCSGGPGKDNTGTSRILKNEYKIEGFNSYCGYWLSMRQLPQYILWNPWFLNNMFLNYEYNFFYMGRVFRVTVFSKIICNTAKLAWMMKQDLCPQCPLMVKFLLQYPKSRVKFSSWE